MSSTSTMSFWNGTNSTRKNSAAENTFQRVCRDLLPPTNDEERIKALLDVLADPSTIEDEVLNEDEYEYEDSHVEDWAFHLLLEEYDSLPDRTIDVMLGILQRDFFDFARELKSLACDVLAKMGERAAPALDTLDSLLPLADSERPSWDWFLALKASRNYLEYQRR